MRPLMPALNPLTIDAVLRVRRRIDGRVDRHTAGQRGRRVAPGMAVPVLVPARPDDRIAHPDGHPRPA